MRSQNHFRNLHAPQNKPYKIVSFPPHFVTCFDGSGLLFSLYCQIDVRNKKQQLSDFALDISDIGKNWFKEREDIKHAIA